MKFMATLEGAMLFVGVAASALVWEDGGPNYGVYVALLRDSNLNVRQISIPAVELSNLGPAGDRLERLATATGGDGENLAPLSRYEQTVKFAPPLPDPMKQAWESQCKTDLTKPIGFTKSDLDVLRQAFKKRPLNLSDVEDLLGSRALCIKGVEGEKLGYVFLPEFDRDGYLTVWVVEDLVGSIDGLEADIF